MQIILLTFSLLIGGLIAYVDSQPTWDDSGVTAVSIFVICTVLGALGPKRPWLWALSVGLWIPVLGIIGKGNYGTLLVLPIAFGGAYLGSVFRKQQVVTATNE